MSKIEEILGERRLASLRKEDSLITVSISFSSDSLPENFQGWREKQSGLVLFTSDRTIWEKFFLHRIVEPDVFAKAYRTYMNILPLQRLLECHNAATAGLALAEKEQGPLGYKIPSILEWKKPFDEEMFGLSCQTILVLYPDIPTEILSEGQKTALRKTRDELSRFDQVNRDLKMRLTPALEFEEKVLQMTGNISKELGPLRDEFLRQEQANVDEHKKVLAECDKLFHM